MSLPTKFFVSGKRLVRDEDGNRHIWRKDGWVQFSGEFKKFSEVDKDEAVNLLMVLVNLKPDEASVKLYAVPKDQVVTPPVIGPSSRSATLEWPEATE